MNNTKSKILKVALRMVSERGYEWLSFQKIADEVGIAKSSIYHYFRKKEDLGITVMEIILEKIKNKEKVILTYKTEKEKLEAYLKRIDPEEKIYSEAMAKLFFDFRGLPLKLQEKLKKFSTENYEFVLDILKRGVEKKEFNLKQDLKEAAIGIILMNIGEYFYNRIFDEKDMKNININHYITSRIIN